MAKNNFYRGLIFTNHALQRMDERYLPKEWVSDTFHHPDDTAAAKQDGILYKKTFGPSTVSVIAKQNENNEWIILSCWIDPPYPGTKDYKRKERYKQYQQAGFWGKLWITLKNQLGI